MRRILLLGLLLIIIEKCYSQNYPRLSILDSTYLSIEIKVLENICISEPELNYPWDLTIVQKNHIDSLYEKKYKIWTECIEKKDAAINYIVNSPQTYFHLIVYNEIIYNSLFDNYYKNYNKITLLSLINIPVDIKNKILSDNKTPNYIKAKLGDKTSEKVFIDQFNTFVVNKDYYSTDFQTCIWNMFYINSKESMQAVFEAMQKDSYIEVKELNIWGFDATVKNSIVYYILNFGFYKFFPQVKEFNTINIDDILKEKGKSVKGKYMVNYTKEELQPYFESVEEKIYEIYGVKIKINASLLRNESETGKQ